METKSVDLIVDVHFLLDIEILSRHIGFRLIEIVCRDEIGDRILWKEGLELPVELGRKCLVMAQDQSGLLDLLNKLCHSEGLSASCNSLQGLCPVPFQVAVVEGIHSLSLVS